MKPEDISSKESVLILSPSANDGKVACEVLEAAGITSRVCHNVSDLCEHVRRGCAAAVIAEEALTVDAVDSLQVALDEQSEWSDLPMIILTGDDVERATELFSHSGNVSLLERPFSRLTLIRSVEVALRARKKQYEVRDLLNALRRSKDDADRANTAKSQFLANMSHEIRTPIGAIMGFVDLLKDPRNTEEEKLNYMAVVERNSHQLLRLIDDILDLSKVEAGKMIIEHLNFKLTDMLADFGSIMVFKASEKGIGFRMRIDGLIPDQICTDPVRLRQILANIVGNAIKFTNQGGVELQVSWRNDKLRFVVKDTGVGLTKEQSARLFQPFAQADSSTTRKFGGTGLGLVLSRSLAAALGGKLELQSSEQGVGSVFIIEISPGRVETAKMVDHSAVGFDTMVTKTKNHRDRLRGMKVLLVEDSPDNQMLIATYLRKTGASIKVACDGAEGVEMAQAEAFDVVLMDVQMPRLDGHEATKRLRSEKFDRPIIALTAHAMKEERMRCFESGFTDFLTKPIHGDRLIEVLTRYGR